MSTSLALAAGAVGMPGSSRAGPLMRALGLYVAGCAGAIQLLDIVVDRFALPDRLFFMAVLTAIAGAPIIGAAALLYDVATGERRRPHRARAIAGSVAPLIEPPHSADETTPSFITRSGDIPQRHATLRTRLDLALSWHHLAHVEAAGGRIARAHAPLHAFIAEADQLGADLQDMVAEARSELRRTAGDLIDNGPTAL